MRGRRRCRRLLEEATGPGAKEPTHARGPFVEMDGVPSLPRRVAFDLDEASSTLRLCFWPADTPSQARALLGPRARQACPRPMCRGRLGRRTESIQIGLLECVVGPVRVVVPAHRHQLLLLRRDELEGEALSILVGDFLGPHLAPEGVRLQVEVERIPTAIRRGRSRASGHI